jgi:two-component system phosphate regulon sensor histidine kinase PhoR
MLGTAETTGTKSILRKILDATREGVIVVTSDGLRITDSNAAARLAFAPQASLEGRPLEDVIENAEVIEAFRTASRDGKTSDIHLKHKLEYTRRYDVHIAPLELGSEQQAIGYFYDVTQVHRLENIRQVFLSNISHELRTPLTSILAFVETLENGGLEDDENNRHFLDVIRRNGERMKNLIAEILELSQIEAGNVSLTVTDVKVSDLVNEIMTSLSSMAATREITLENRVAADAIVRADHKRLEQMLTNLIDNAIRFNRRGGSVTVSDRVAAGRHLVSIADTGEGIGPKEMGRVFERFYRVDRARTREVGGTGLGLAIVKHLARLHGGEVSVDSELGVGTRFTIELPNSSPA